MKKILLTCTDLMAVQFFIDHIKYWSTNELAVDVVCSPVGNRVDELIKKLEGLSFVTVKTVQLSRSPVKLSNLKGYTQLKKIIKETDYDLIITNEPVMGLMTRLAARKSGVKVIYICHGFHFFKGNNAIKNFIFRTIEKFAARYTDILVTINHEDFEASKKFKLKKGGEFKYIPGIGVNLKRFAPVNAEKREELRNALGIKPNEIALVAVAELNQNKNQQILIRGIAKIKNSNIKLFLVGKGDNAQNLVELAKSLGIEKQVVLLGYRHDVPQILPAFDIGTSASVREGLGLNLIEEMASGLPIIAAVNRGHKDIVEEESGFLFNANDVDSFVNALENLLVEDKRIEMGKFNIQSCRRFELEKVESMLFKIIEEEL